MSNTYMGYRVKIGDTIISNDLIQKGSYQFDKSKRIASNWTDAELKEHQIIDTNRKVHITFNLRERNLAEQATLSTIFATQENLLVTYWDDYDCSYQSSYFFMDAPKIQHKNTIGGINYAATTIKLTEY